MRSRTNAYFRVDGEQVLELSLEAALVPRAGEYFFFRRCAFEFRLRVSKVLHSYDADGLVDHSGNDIHEVTLYCERLSESQMNDELQKGIGQV